jgi:hypothetical protein
MTTCPLCDSASLEPLLDRRGVPVHQNMPRATRAEARDVVRGDLVLACCAQCGFIFNTTFRDDLIEYGEAYDNDQNWSPRFEAHVDSLIDAMIAAGVAGSQVVEVGCGRGDFLRRLCSRGNNRGVGFDASYVGPESIDDGRVTFVAEFYGRGHRHVAPDAVVCRHVIEHVPSPLELLGAVREALEHAATLHFETPDVMWILRRGVIQDFFYEHCSYFTPATLAFAFARAGFRVSDVRHVFADQYMWAEAAYAPSKPLPEPRIDASEVLEAVRRYRREESQKLERMQNALVGMRKRGPVAIWGAGAKGVTFLNLLDAKADLVDCVIDINPRKQGRFLPGTGHEIVGPNALAERGITDVVVMNENYIAEIRASLGAENPVTVIHNEAEL